MRRSVIDGKPQLTDYEQQIMYLCRDGEPRTTKDLVAHMKCHEATVSRCLKRLVDSELLVAEWWSPEASYSTARPHRVYYLAP